MTLPASGQISFSQVSTELGASSTATRSLGDSTVRTLAGVASGAISMSNLHGKSNVTWTVGGVNYAAGVQQHSDDFSASITITCNQTATWTYTRNGQTIYNTVSLASGATGTVISIGQEAESVDVDQWATTSATVYLTSTVGSVSRSWDITITANGNELGGG